MRWANGRAQIADKMTAEVWQSFGQTTWVSRIYSEIDGPSLWFANGHADQAAAKAAVCHWIGKTMAQFSNALAAGCNKQDDGA